MLAKVQNKEYKAKSCCKVQQTFPHKVQYSADYAYCNFTIIVSISAAFVRNIIKRDFTTKN